MAEDVGSSCGSAVEGDVHTVKYVVVTGGTLSGLGKGTTISSLGVVLKSLGLRVTAIKIDPYLNIDAGTMSPYEHGEVYVLEDGGEVDLDLGNYERFLSVTLSRDHNLTTGKVFEAVMRSERRGDYLGRTVQIVPHVTNTIQHWIQKVAARPVDNKAEKPDVCLIEVGGTVGDIESAVYLEALQQFSYKVGLDNICLCHLSYVPVLGCVGEQKTKPTQHSVKELRKAGLKPDFIFCRSEQMLTAASKSKISMFSQVTPSQVISVHDVENVYQVPLVMDQQNVGAMLLERLKLKPRICSPIRDGRAAPASLSHWHQLAYRDSKCTTEVRVGVVGKYTGLADSYLSVAKALQHSALECELKLRIVWVESTDLEISMRNCSIVKNRDAYEEAWSKLRTVHAVLVPGGFGDRGIEGMIEAAKFARQNKIPYFGICLGMQIAVIEFARNVLGLKCANSEEFDSNSDEKVVVYMPETVNQKEMGGTMRLGNRATHMRELDSISSKLYDRQSIVFERHRHRYEVNPDYVSRLEERGLHFVAQDDKGQRMEIMELDEHPFFVACQFHPEFTSRPIRPNPMFLGFILASMGRLNGRLAKYDQQLRAGITYFRDPDSRTAIGDCENMAPFTL